MYIADATNVCGDSHTLVVTALGKHSFAINDSGALNIATLISRLNDQLQYRAEKVLFLSAEPGASYSDFIEMTNAIYHPDVSVSLLTRHVRASAQDDGCLMMRGYPRRQTH
jgi:biopolymer transport protein ExbD